MKRNYTEEELIADIEAVSARNDPAKKERDAYFADPANAAEIAAQQTRMDLVCALYKARKDAGLTQQQLADILGIKQTYIAQIEKGKKNVTLATIAKYAFACGKHLNFNLA